ncbi:hypothetical protein RJ639_025860, partial [Escallonia herrerae]
MIRGGRLFHEQDVEAKKEFYTRDSTRSVLLNSNYDLFTSRTANWRDSLIMSVSVYQSLESNYFLAICRFGVPGVVFTYHWYYLFSCTERMVVSGVQETVVEAALEYDRTKELEAFDETKAGVKGLIDNGLVKIPKIFVRLNTNNDLFKSMTANWRDTLIISVSSSGTLDPNEFPAIC